VGGSPAGAALAEPDLSGLRSAGPEGWGEPVAASGPDPRPEPSAVREAGTPTTTPPTWPGPPAADDPWNGSAGVPASSPTATSTVEATTTVEAAPPVAGPSPGPSAGPDPGGEDGEPSGTDVSGRVAQVAELVQLPPEPGPGDIARRRADVEAYRRARREADELVAASAASTQRLADARQRLADIDRRLHRNGSAAEAAADPSSATTGHAIDHRLRAAVLQQRSRDMARRWQTYALGRQLLFDAIADTDRALASALEHRAAGHLRAFTDGAWTDLAVDTGGLDLRDRHGVHRDVRAVGTGLARLASLALRIAMAEDDAAVGARTALDAAPAGDAGELDGDRPVMATGPARHTTGALPLLIDDVVLGLDEDHRAGVVRRLAQLAEHRQVVVFTSDSSLGDLARRHRRGVRVVELR
jgi:hypothetical protein